MKTLIFITALLTSFTSMGAGVTAYTNRYSLYVDPYGSISKASKGHPDLPFSTIGSAEVAASAGDTIFVNPGNYFTNNLIKTGVNYHFYPGASVTYTADSSISMFDDQNVATTNIIGGNGDFKFAGLDSGFDTAAVIKLQNSNTVFTLHANKLSATNSGAVEGSTSVMWIYDCKKAIIDVDDIGVTGNDAVGGVYWVHGETHVKAKRLATSGFPVIYSSADTGNVVPSDLHVEADEIIATNATAIYTAGETTNSVIWVRANRITSAGEAVVQKYTGANKLYVVAEKIQSNGSTIAAIGAGDLGTVDQGFLWVTAQKVSSRTKFVDISYCTTRFDVMEYEDTGGVTIGVNIRAGTNYFKGGTMKVLNGKGFNISGGTTLIENMTIDTSQTDTTNNVPIFISGGTVKLKNCTLIAPASAYSINSSNAQTVKIYGTVTANRTNNVNITRSPAGTFVVDSGVL